MRKSALTAGALIGLGLAAIGIGTRYQSFADLDASGNVRWLTFRMMDTPLTLILVLLVISLAVGMGVAFMGLAFHHHRRHLEMLHEHGPALHEHEHERRLPV